MSAVSESIWPNLCWHESCHWKRALLFIFQKQNSNTAIHFLFMQLLWVLEDFTEICRIFAGYCTKIIFCWWRHQPHFYFIGAGEWWLQDDCDELQREMWPPQGHKEMNGSPWRNGCRNKVCDPNLDHVAEELLIIPRKKNKGSKTTQSCWHLSQMWPKVTDDGCCPFGQTPPQANKASEEMGWWPGWWGTVGRAQRAWKRGWQIPEDKKQRKCDLVFTFMFNFDWNESLIETEYIYRWREQLICWLFMMICASAKSKNMRFLLLFVIIHIVVGNPSNCQ